MGPNNVEKVVEISRFDRLRFGIKKTVNTYFDRPTYYLFHVALFVMFVAFLAHWSLPWQYYAVLIMLGLGQSKKFKKFLHEAEEFFVAKEIKDKDTI